MNESFFQHTKFLEATIGDSEYNAIAKRGVLETLITLRLIRANQNAQPSKTKINNTLNQKNFLGFKKYSAN